MIGNAALPVWRAKWIDPEVPHDAEARLPASCLRKRFSVANPASACLYITCHGLYAAFLNGKRVGDFVLAPGTGDYRKRLTMQCYDVTELLKAGGNELTITLGDGWYRGGVGIDSLALLSQLELNDPSISSSLPGPRGGKIAVSRRRDPQWMAI